MDAKEFVAIVAAVLAGNAMTVGFLAGIWHVNKDPKKTPLALWIAMFLPLIVVAGASQFLLT